MQTASDDAAGTGLSPIGVTPSQKITIKYAQSSVLHKIIGPQLDPNFKALHRDGFVIYKSAVKTSDLLATIRDEHIYWQGGLPQSTDLTDGHDTKRVMSKEASNAFWNKELRARLAAAFATKAILTSTDGSKTFCRMRAIMSFPTEGYDETYEHWQVGDQGEHTDEHTDKMMSLRDEDMPLSVIVAFMPNTRLRVLSKGTWRVLRLQPGDVLFFRGDLCHHGMGYDSVNVRVHCHLYAKFYTPFQPVSIHACSGFDRAARGTHAEAPHHDVRTARPPRARRRCPPPPTAPQPPPTAPNRPPDTPPTPRGYREFTIAATVPGTARIVPARCPPACLAYRVPSAAHRPSPAARQPTDSPPPVLVCRRRPMALLARPPKARTWRRRRVTCARPGPRVLAGAVHRPPNRPPTAPNRPQPPPTTSFPTHPAERCAIVSSR